MRKIELKDADFRSVYGARTKKSIKSIKQILIDQGYTEAQIKYMKLNSQVVIAPTSYAGKIVEDTILLVLDEPPRAKIKVAKSNRFASIGSEEK